MKASFYAGASGLLAHQENLNNIGNNLANVNSTGFKGRVLSFDDLLYTQMYANTPTDPLSGNGVKAVDGGIFFEQSAMRQTHYTLDYAVAGDAFFAIEKNGNRLYTRSGEFAIKLEGDNAYLACQDGSYVLGWTGERIPLEKIQGTNEYDLNAPYPQIGLFRFNNPSQLTSINGTRFSPTEASGPALVAAGGTSKLMQGYIESSSTVMADEMTNMIAAQRAYQVSARVLQVSDENEQTINNLRK